MKKLLQIVIPLLLIVGCSQKPTDETTLIEKDGVMYLPDSDKPYTGEVFTNYDTGEKLYQGTYENGQKSVEDTWKEGRPISTKSWHRNGSLNQ